MQLLIVSAKIKNIIHKDVLGKHYLIFHSKLSDEVSSNFHPINSRLLLNSGSYFIGAKLLTCEIKSCSCGKLTFASEQIYLHLWIDEENWLNIIILFQLMANNYLEKS